MAKHTLKRVTGGNDRESWVTPTCSCGWVGPKQSCYNNFQLHDVARDERMHLAKGGPDEKTD